MALTSRNLKKATFPSFLIISTLVIGNLLVVVRHSSLVFIEQQYQQKNGYQQQNHDHEGDDQDENLVSSGDDHSPNHLLYDSDTTIKLWNKKTHDDDLSYESSTSIHSYSPDADLEKSSHANIVDSALSKSISPNDNSTFTKNTKYPELVVGVVKEGQTTRRRFAYAFLMAGCNPNAHNGLLYHVVIVKEFFRSVNSIADVVVLVRMSPSSSNSDNRQAAGNDSSDTNTTTRNNSANSARLPASQEKILTDNGVIVKYIPTPVVDNFFTAQMDKFRILGLLGYERVLYIDSDVMPLCNLDYLFINSVRNATGDSDMESPSAAPLFQENVILQGKIEASQGGFFMMTPNRQDADEVMDIINKRYSQSYTNFDESVGWGHVIKPPDHWDSLYETNMTTWKFYGGNADQGLLYYWTKYKKKKVSIIGPQNMETWGVDMENGTEHEHEEYATKLLNVKSTIEWRRAIGKTIEMGWTGNEFYHFSGKKKPYWRGYSPENMEFHIDDKMITNKTCHSMARGEKDKLATSLWFYFLKKALMRAGLSEETVLHEFPMKSHPQLGRWAPKRVIEESVNQKHEYWHDEG
jgi:hypothetical protein